MDFRVSIKDTTVGHIFSYPAYKHTHSSHDHAYLKYIYTLSKMRQYKDSESS